MRNQKTGRNLLAWALSLSLLLSCATALAASETVQLMYTAVASSMDAQNETDAALLGEAAFGYTFSDPLCVVNPYGNVPLCALLIFDTAEETTVSMTVKGHDPADDVTAEFPAATRHILPVIGLYADESNTVELSLPDGSMAAVMIETEALNNEALLTGNVTVPAGIAFDTSKLTFLTIGNTQCVIAYDSHGDLRYYAEFPARRTTPLRQLPNGRFLVCSDNTALDSEANGGFMEVDLCGRVYRQFLLPGGFHHEILVLPNGNYMIASSQDDLAVLMDRIVEVDHVTGNIVWDLDLSEIMDSTDGSGTSYREKDWAHINAISYDGATGSVLLSCRGIDAVVSVDKQSKTINWILGNPEGWSNTDLSLFFTPAEGQADFEWNYAQHDATFLDSTHILMFDNGTNRYKTVTPEDERNTAHYSRAVLYNIDPAAMTITQEWSYGKERGLEWYSSRFCSADYDATADAYWICSGTTEYDPVSDAYVENVSTLSDPGAAVTLTKVDLVRGQDLLYELVPQVTAYRMARLNPYAYPVNLDITVPGAIYTYTKTE